MASTDPPTARPCALLAHDTGSDTAAARASGTGILTKVNATGSLARAALLQLIAPHVSHPFTCAEGEREELDDEKRGPYASSFLELDASDDFCDSSSIRISLSSTHPCVTLSHLQSAVGLGLFMLLLDLSPPPLPPRSDAVVAPSSDFLVPRDLTRILTSRHPANPLPQLSALLLLPSAYGWVSFPSGAASSVPSCHIVGYGVVIPRLRLCDTILDLGLQVFFVDVVSRRRHVISVSDLYLNLRSSPSRISTTPPP
ncbi:hypothetical protein B0H14DRAFT_3878434 [Mycena olivaceomarginata]|nr:hypothetical protein B0H14DRAFT_3878434 [Mycena olivaceomarginata]